MDTTLILDNFDEIELVENYHNLNILFFAFDDVINKIITIEEFGIDDGILSLVNENNFLVEQGFVDQEDLYNPKKVIKSFEGIIDSLIEGIKKIINKIIEYAKKFLDFIKNLFSFNSNLKKTNEKAKEEIKETINEISKKKKYFTLTDISIKEKEKWSRNVSENYKKVSVKPYYPIAECVLNTDISQYKNYINVTMRLLNFYEFACKDIEKLIIKNKKYDKLRQIISYINSFYSSNNPTYKALEDYLNNLAKVNKLNLKFFEQSSSRSYNKIFHLSEYRVLLTKQSGKLSDAFDFSNDEFIEYLKEIVSRNVVSMNNKFVSKWDKYVLQEVNDIFESFEKIQEYTKKSISPFYKDIIDDLNKKIKKAKKEKVKEYTSQLQIFKSL